MSRHCRRWPPRRQRLLEGLTARDLDPSSRILAVADVAEALSSECSCRPALSLDRVLTIVRGAATNRTLDQDACAALEEVLPAWAAGGRTATVGEGSGAV